MPLPEKVKSRGVQKVRTIKRGGVTYHVYILKKKGKRGGKTYVEKARKQPHGSK